MNTNDLIFLCVNSYITLNRTPKPIWNSQDISYGKGVSTLIEKIIRTYILQFSFLIMYKSCVRKIYQYVSWSDMHVYMHLMEVLVWRQRRDNIHIYSFQRAYKRLHEILTGKHYGIYYTWKTKWYLFFWFNIHISLYNFFVGLGIRVFGTSCFRIVFFKS